MVARSSRTRSRPRRRSTPRWRSWAGSRRDVDIVINSHLHYDHAENNLAFPQAQFYVSDEEWRWASDPSSAQAWAYDIDWTGDDVTFMNYCLVQRDHYDVMPGLRIIQTPGHTPGHQSVLVTTDEGVLCVTGDAACMMENLTLPTPPGTHVGSAVSLGFVEEDLGPLRPRPDEPRPGALQVSELRSSRSRPRSDFPKCRLSPVTPASLPTNLATSKEES